MKIAKVSPHCSSGIRWSSGAAASSITQDEILRYFETLAADSGMPLLLYNAPGNTHHTIAPDTVYRAAQIENIVGLKDSGMSMGYFHEVKALLADRDDFSMLVGHEELLAECVLLGGHGGMAASSNIDPRLFVDLYNSAADGDITKVLSLHRQAVAFGRSIYRGSNPLRGLKCGLRLLDICSGILSEPLADYSPEEGALVQQYIDHHRSRFLGDQVCA